MVPVIRPYLQEGKVLILVDLYCEHRIPRGLSQTPQAHLSIKKVHHRFLR